MFPEDHAIQIYHNIACISSGAICFFKIKKDNFKRFKRQNVIIVLLVFKNPLRSSLRSVAVASDQT